MSYKGTLSRLVKHIRSARRAQKKSDSPSLRAHIKELAKAYNVLSRSVQHRPMEGK